MTSRSRLPRACGKLNADAVRRHRLRPFSPSRAAVNRRPASSSSVNAPTPPPRRPPLIAREVERAVHDGKRLLVYVGAPWCAPCTAFHAAATAGKLDATFGDLRLLVFDADRDTEALGRAGYVSRLIPLFAIPRDDGRSSTRQIEEARSRTAMPSRRSRHVSVRCSTRGSPRPNAPQGRKPRNNPLGLLCEPGMVGAHCRAITFPGGM